MAGAVAGPAAANPVVAGDHPDPSLLRAGDVWYSATTSGNWLPAFPVLRSADLRGWRQVGAVFTHRPRWVAGDLWAPELVGRDGRVLAYYTALGREGRRCVAAAVGPRLSGPYRDHGPLVCTQIGAIDAVPVRDEHGHDWLVWKVDGNSRGRPTPIVAAPLAPGGLSLAGPPRELFRADLAWEQGLVEAPAFLRRDGLFYMVYSAGRCCGLPCTYATGIARSRSLLGPWEKRPEPLLDDSAVFRCPGHAGVADGPDGVPVLAYHAYVRGDPANRQLLVGALDFGADGWPRVVLGETAAEAAPEQRIGFAGPAPRGCARGRAVCLARGGWQWAVGPTPTASVVGDGRRARLRLGRGVLARQARTATFRASVDVARRGAGAGAALAVMASTGNAVGVTLRARRAVAWRTDDGRTTRLASIRTGSRRGAGPGRRPGAPRAVRLRIHVGRTIRLALRARGPWRRVGAAQPHPRWRGGPRVAMRVSGARGAWAEFDDLRIAPRP